MQAEKSETIGKAIANHIEQDIDKNLTETFIRKHPQCNCHCLALRLLLAQPPWSKSDRALFNLADLILPDLGKLECRYILPGEQEVKIPLEARDNRIGYLVVQLEAELKQVELIGFISPKQVNFATEAIAISQLQPTENLFRAIEQPRSRSNLSSKYYRTV